MDFVFIAEVFDLAEISVFGGITLYIVIIPLDLID